MVPPMRRPDYLYFIRIGEAGRPVDLLETFGLYLWHDIRPKVPVLGHSTFRRRRWRRSRYDRVASGYIHDSGFVMPDAEFTYKDLCAFTETQHGGLLVDEDGVLVAEARGASVLPVSLNWPIV